MMSRGTTRFKPFTCLVNGPVGFGGHLPSELARSNGVTEEYAKGLAVPDNLGLRQVQAPAPAAV